LGTSGEVFAIWILISAERDDLFVYSFAHLLFLNVLLFACVMLRKARRRASVLSPIDRENERWTATFRVSP